MMTDKAVSNEAVGVTAPKDPPALETVPPIPYSVFSKSQRRWMTLIIGVAMMFSPLSANIYLPCIPLLRQDMHTSLQLINLTVTAYVIFQGITPAFFGELSDKVGRRPVYIITFAIYVASNVGLACQDRYAALLLLRMVQSLGASATVAIGYSVIANIVTPAKRGRVLGPAMVATNLGPILGPVIGGPLAGKVGWRWVFWFLTILRSVFFFAILFFLPETCRSIVGNGSVPAKGWSRHWLSHIAGRRQEILQSSLEPSTRKEKEPLMRKLKVVMPNPWKSLKLLFERDTALVLSVSAVFYMVYYIIQTSIPQILQRIYKLNEADIGLCYIAIGCGVAIGGFFNGQLMDFNYRATAKKVGFKIDKVVGDDLRNFPIERARSRFVVVYVLLHTTCLVGYGWALHQRVHLAGPLILQFCLGFLATCIVQSFNTLLVDIHRDNPSTAAASGNIARCTLSAGGVAAMQSLLDMMGDGVFFTVLGCVSGGFGYILILVVRRYGRHWRGQREDKAAHLEMDLEATKTNGGQVKDTTPSTVSEEQITNIYS